MKIKPTVFIYLVLGLLLLHAPSCKKFLQVQPRDYMFEEEAFSTPKGVESVLNGIYQSLADSLSYGNALSMNATENMAQYYYSFRGPYSNVFRDFIYVVPEARTALNNIWSQSYRTILGINNFCERLEAPSFNVLPAAQKNIMLGEAYAIRACLHFDLLRMFGPVYVKNAASPAIPYVKIVAREAQPVLPASEVISAIIKDLEASLALLENDPVRTKGPDWSTVSGEGQAVDYFSNRQRRMNYFAVKAYTARVLLYAGKKTESWNTVQSILTAQETFFPWPAEPDYSKDPLLSKETFFGIENRKMYEYDRRMFSALLNDEVIATPAPARLAEIYNTASKDLRLKYWFKVGLEGNKTYKVMVKFSNTTVTNSWLRYFQPLIRKSELYLIAAETAPTLEQGYFYLNTLRVNKGLPPVEYHSGSTSVELMTNIRNEYQREFIGEGQLFFMFKRLNLGEIPSYTGESTIAMDDYKYVPPVPDDESWYR
ncbi:RagB/SusD family nutrient uptake outer membrane protein [Pseudoflavitalea rhizosphaerae]|uniref:RagB/SusD family nutrient uptake outer membrane protein n=1 Tax=Pseudoflavitalea rhizosphaerae TaxID=1884793 RepID=UPI000F8C7D42|nr:RagB/SusD family nutrient uptake outer membrane protein [Pseudoflavitalea rhizosphaerae]